MKLKVCGMKFNPLEVAALGPEYLGFIFWEPSPRYFGEGTAPDLDPGITRVGVFVDAGPDAILERVAAFRLGAVQLHGGESPAFCEALKAALDLGFSGKVELLKAFSVGDGFRFDALEAYLPHCDFFLFDTRGKLPGGNGTAFDWGLLGAYPFEKPFFLSGGIGPEHCRDLEDFLESPAGRYCHALDVNSKFETRPGEKDTRALRTFLECGIWNRGPRTTPNV